MNQGLTPDYPHAIHRIQPDKTTRIISGHTYQSNPPSQRLSSIGSLLAKNILFACSQCDGPLVPSSYCIVCKKTVIRCCSNCGITRDMGLHDSCKNLVLLGKEVSAFSTEPRSLEKNN